MECHKQYFIQCVVGCCCCISSLFAYIFALPEVVWIEFQDLATMNAVVVTFVAGLYSLQPSRKPTFDV